MDSKNLVRSAFCFVLLLLLTVTVAVPAGADTIEKKFPFKLDKWYDIEYEDGDLTIHRVRVEAVEGNFKSRIFRPGMKSDGMFQDVQIQVEYSNDMSRDVTQISRSCGWIPRDERSTGTRVRKTWMRKSVTMR